MKNGFLERVIKRLVLGVFVAAAVVCGGSKHPQTTSNAPQVEAIALNAPQTDAGRPDPSRWNAKVGYPPSEASPQSGCPSRGAIALNRPTAPQSETVADVDIERGWRLVKEATEDIVYTMPEDGVEVWNWGRRGTFGEWMRYELGWGFPLGSNDAVYSAFSVFNDAKIRPTPRDRSHEICAVGVPMLAMQGASRFWVCDGSGGETAPTSAARTKAAPSRAKRMSHEVAARPQTGASDAPKVRARPPVCVPQVSQGASDHA